MFRAFFGALTLTIALWSVLYLNYLLLGQFFFCYFLALVTSIGLKQFKQYILHETTKTFEDPNYLIKSSLLVKLVTFLVDWISKDRMKPVQLFEGLYGQL